MGRLKCPKCKKTITGVTLDIKGVAMATVKGNKIITDTIEDAFERSGPECMYCGEDLKFLRVKGDINAITSKLTI